MNNLLEKFYASHKTENEEAPEFNNDSKDEWAQSLDEETELSES